MQNQVNIVEGLKSAFLKDKKEGRKRLVERFLDPVMDQEVIDQTVRKDARDRILEELSGTGTGKDH